MIVTKRLIHTYLSAVLYFFNLMRLEELTSKITRISILVISFCLMTVGIWSQKLLTSLPDGIFSPNQEQVEDLERGILIYDQYCIHNTLPMIRKESSGVPFIGKIEDLYSNGFLLHKGTYSNGIIKSFTNYYVNGAKERVYKGKKVGEGKLECYFLNGYVRSLYVYKNFNLIEKETYYENGVLKSQEEWDVETMAPTLVVNKNREGTMITTVQLIDKDSMIYVKDVTLTSGERLEYGRMILYPSTGDIINDGPYYTYHRTGSESSKVIYKNGNVDKIVEEKRPDRKIEYYSYELPESEVVDNSSSSGEGQGSGEIKLASSQEGAVPQKFVRFDMDNDDFISNKEVDMAVSEFFEDDSITLDQINSLVNFFFEQD